MKVDFQKIHRDNHLLEMLIIDGLTNALSEKEFHEYTGKRNKSKNKLIDVNLTIDGIEVPLEKFIERWQENVKCMIVEQAKDLVIEKFNDVSDVLSDLEERIKGEVDKRLEEWEKEDDNTPIV